MMVYLVTAQNYSRLERGVLVAVIVAAVEREKDSWEKW